MTFLADMDSLIVDLDKVLDDFEAEETGKKSCPGQETRPSDYSSYVALKDERPWEDLSNVAVSSETSWSAASTNHANQMMAYDIPYSPTDQFDLSEADFAPSTDFKSSITDNCSVGEKIITKPAHLVINGDHKLDLGHVITNGSQDYKYPVQARDEFTPVYENQPFPPDLAHAISNGVNKSNLTYIQEAGEKTDDLRSSLAYHSQAKDRNTYTPQKTGSHQQVAPQTYPSIYNSVDSGVNSIDSNTTLSPTNQELQPVPLLAGNFMQRQEAGSATLHTNSHAGPMDHDISSSLSPKITNTSLNNSLKENKASSVENMDLSGSAFGVQRSIVNNTENSSKETNSLDSQEGLQSSLDSSNTHDVGTASKGLSLQSEDTCVKVCDSFVKEQDSSMTKETIPAKSEDDEAQSKSHDFVSESEALKDSVAVSEEKASAPGDNGHSSSDARIVNRETSNATGNVGESPALVAPTAVGFTDSEVDISDMESYLGDVIDDVGADGQKNVDPEEPVIHSKDFTDSSQMGNQKIENAKESNFTETNTENQHCDVTSDKSEKLGQEVEHEKISQDQDFTVRQSEPPDSSEDLKAPGPLPPNMGVGARPKKPSQPVTGVSDQPPQVQDILPNEAVEQEATPIEQSAGQDPSNQAVVSTDSCVQNSHSQEEEMDPDLAMAIALSLQESGLEEAVMRPPGDGGQLPGRPHSWGPGDGIPHQQRRPNSLKLPPRGDGGLERSSAPYTFPYPNDAQPGSDVDRTPEGRTSQEDQDPNSASETNAPTEEPQGAGFNPLGVGHVAPVWIPDSQAPTCMSCDLRFTFTKRRHHCRGCGKVLCSSCCNLKSRLPYMDNKEARVCVPCHQILEAAVYSGGVQGAAVSGEAPAATTPAGVLKRDGSHRRHEPKQVIFSDGIRPGGDLTELDGSNKASSRLPLRRSTRSQKRVEKSSADGGGRRVRSGEMSRTQCLIPETGLPPVVLSVKPNEDVILDDQPAMEKYLPQIKDEDAEPVTFALCSNLHVLIKILSLDCCVNRVCWSFTTQGMCTVGQDEIVIILESLPEEDMIPLDIFRHLYHVYEEAGKGITVSDMGHSIFTQTFLNDRDHGGFLYIKPTFQCLHKLVLPTPPYLFGILLQKWEMPWAKVFPIRLLLRLGAEYRYYPCPLISIRNRKPVFFEIGHTIMNLLADFRNFQYMLPQIRGITIHMQDKRTTINFPRNRYEDLMKVVENSNEHVMAIGACFSTEADSHLVCIQNDDGNYQTQAINIQNKPRKVTGASFVVFNGALKPSSGLKAKSSIVEDGLMVQITPESMAALKQSIKDMKDFTIACGPLSSQSPDEVVLIQWVREDKHINIGVKSPIDGKAMDGITSVHIPHATDYAGEHRVIRWTDVFFIENKDGGSREPVDVSRMAETLANAACIALTPHLDRLKEANLVKIGLRVTLETDKVGYDIGGNEEKLPDLYMNDLDNELIPVIHSAVPLCRGGSVVLELIFHILK